MHVNLAKSAGFCSGVRRALRIAYDTATRSGKVSMLGDIVHNEDVLREIRKTGIRKIRRLAKSGEGTLLVCAHGAPRSTIDMARRHGYSIVDATCPMVKEIHRIAARIEKSGRRVIVIGDARHDEVRGIVGQLKTKAVVIDGLDVPSGVLRGITRAGAVVQSTQNPAMVREVVKKLKARIKDLEFHDTICRPTTRKQKEILSMARKNDVMVIIGSRSSANTRRLYELSKSLNRRTHWISGNEEMKRTWFRGAESVGVGAGASTPDSVTQEVVSYLASVGRQMTKTGSKGKSRCGAKRKK
jgi:4-hydroxy-3-methylbut-2-enyl diphosphate reductase